MRAYRVIPLGRVKRVCVRNDAVLLVLAHASGSDAHVLGARSFVAQLSVDQTQELISALNRSLLALETKARAQLNETVDTAR
jgi:hypothetical protein